MQGQQRIHLRVWNTLMRTKQFDPSASRSQLRRCLTTLDLTVVGLGCISGVGIYILTGTVLRDKTGPCGFISYAIAGIVALINAMCYAELGCRIPKAGSAYTFTYVAAGELPAFIIGWSVVQEYLIGAASVARGWSGTLDVLSNGLFRNLTIEYIGRLPNVEYISEYPDVLAGTIIIILGLVVMTGAKLSAQFNLVITAINMVVLLFTIITMYIFAKPTQFAPVDEGGLFPFGFPGILSGAATLFYSYIGFDAIVVSVEEALDPCKSIPRALIYTISGITILKIICAIALVLYTPWWTLDRTSGFVAAFRTEDLYWASWITGVGSLLGITAVLLICLFSAPRIIYAMASDGLLFRFLGYVWPRTQAPIGAIAIICPLASITAILFDIKTLADFISIGTLIAYMMVACCSLSSRYRVPQYLAPRPSNGLDAANSEVSVYETEADNVPMNAMDNEHPFEGTLKEHFRNAPIINRFQPGTVCLLAVWGYVLFALGFGMTLLVGLPYVRSESWWSILLLCLFAILAIACVIIMAMHEQNIDFESYHTPFVPILPCLCILLNICLVLELSGATWVRFSIWLAMGLVIYFCYGIFFSVERNRPNRVVSNPN